jgi:membrane protease YdiL (CAAX protease family)
MYKISLWASRHIWPARVIIVCCNVAATFLAVFIGAALYDLEITLPRYWFYGAVALFLATFLIYPQKNVSRFKRSYKYRKACDSLLLLTTFVFTICIGNQPQQLLRITTLPLAAAVPSSETPAKFRIDNAGKSIQPGIKKWSKRALKKTLRERIKVLKTAYEESGKGRKIAMIILSILVALMLLFLVAAISCNIACAGADGLAILVLLLGVGIITLLFVRTVRRIKKGPRQKNQPGPQPT